MYTNPRSSSIRLAAVPQTSQRLVRIRTVTFAVALVLILVSFIPSPTDAAEVTITIECNGDKYEVKIKTTFYDDKNKPIGKDGQKDWKTGGGTDPRGMRIEVTVTPDKAPTADKKLLFCPMVNCAFPRKDLNFHTHTVVTDSKMTAACAKCGGGTCGGAGKWQRKFTKTQNQRPSYRFECIEFEFKKDKKDPQVGYAKGDGSTKDAKKHIEDMSKIVGCGATPHAKRHRTKAAA